MDYKKIKYVQIMVYARNGENFWTLTKDIDLVVSIGSSVKDISLKELAGYHQNHLETAKNHLEYAKEFVELDTVELEFDVRYASGLEPNGHLTTASNIVDVDEVVSENEIRTNLSNVWKQTYN